LGLSLEASLFSHVKIEVEMSHHGRKKATANTRGAEQTTAKLKDILKPIKEQYIMRRAYLFAQKSLPAANSNADPSEPKPKPCRKRVDRWTPPDRCSV
jgi:hypothetical protein